MKKSIVNIGKPLSKVEQKEINGGDNCPDLNCYYTDTPDGTLRGTHCGSCYDYHALPASCGNRVKVDVRCFGF